MRWVFDLTELIICGKRHLSQISVWQVPGAVCSVAVVLGLNRNWWAIGLMKILACKQGAGRALAMKYVTEQSWKQYLIVSKRVIVNTFLRHGVAFQLITLVCWRYRSDEQNIVVKMETHARRQEMFCLLERDGTMAVGMHSAHSYGLTLQLGIIRLIRGETPI